MANAPYINPLNDFFIRYLFAEKGNEELCRSFINAVLADADFPPVKKITIKNPFNLKTEISSKESITDIKAESGDGKTFDIEVQIGNKGDFVKRSLYYGSKIYSSGLPEGEDYKNLKPVVMINLLGYELWPDVEKTHSCFMLIDKADRQSALTEDFIMHFVEAPKLEKYPEKLNGNLKNWLEYFREEGLKGEEEMKVLMANDAALAQAHERYKRFTGSQEYREAYEAKKKWEHDRVSEINYAERRGMEKGMEKGAYEKALQTAQKLHAKGFTVEEITDLTGLSAAEVEKLKIGK